MSKIVVSYCVTKSLIFNVVQPVNLVFCKMIKMIQQNIFNHADLYLGPHSLLPDQINIFS